MGKSRKRKSRQKVQADRRRGRESRTPLDGPNESMFEVTDDSLCDATDGGAWVSTYGLFRVLVNAYAV